MTDWVLEHPWWTVFIGEVVMWGAVTAVVYTR